jgi:YgiT-type zinc finger domain-containing protein
MQCIVQGCPGEMEERRIVHTFVRDGKPIVIEDLPALVCPICGYTVLDVRVLDVLFALDPEKDTLVGQAPVFRLSLDLTPAGVE